jgi:hypothetical protein
VHNKLHLSQVIVLIYHYIHVLKTKVLYITYISVVCALVLFHGNTVNDIWLPIDETVVDIDRPIG